MAEELINYLLKTEGKDRAGLGADNPYRELAFDSGKKRCGWLRCVSFPVIKEAIGKLIPVLGENKHFVFLGIGGSGNGIKALLSLYENKTLYTLDSLDPRALEEVIKKLDKDNTLIIPISKSGTTQETQLLANTFKEFYGANWQKHFLWLSDPSAFEKLNSLGWKESAKGTIQADGESDMGGRFSCPGSLIFLLPLFILLNKDFNALEEIYSHYCRLQEEGRTQAYRYWYKYSDSDKAFFNIRIDKKVKDTFYSWVVQLFQESLGSKKNKFFVKTESEDVADEDFMNLEFNLNSPEPVVKLMCNMYFFQVFVALYAGIKGINFVDQPYVEKYKAEMRRLQGRSIEGIPGMTIDQVINTVQNKITKDQRFIDIILYLAADKNWEEDIRKKVSLAFPDKKVFVFIGSDWNHHSYQAAFGDRTSFYVLVLKKSYLQEIPGVSSKTISSNIDTLKLISNATYLTIKDKSILVYLLQG